MKLRLTSLVFLCMAACLGGVAKADQTCADALVPFQKADRFFTQAQTAPPSVAQSLWRFGTQLLGAHHDDAAPTGCDADEFNLTRLMAFEHGLKIGYAWAGLSPDEAHQRSDLLFNEAVLNVRGTRTVDEVRASWDRTHHALYAAAVAYSVALYDAAMASKVARHKPSSTNCSTPNVDAEVLTPVTPEYPIVAKESGLRGITVLVRVIVAASGAFTEGAILQSSANMALDRASLEAARASTYLPKIANCVAVPGTYIFRVDYGDDYTVRVQ